MKTEAWHVIPRNDLEEHTKDESCKCLPAVRKTSSGVLVVHNAFDGRHVLEQAREVLHNHKR